MLMIYTRILKANFRKNISFPLEGTCLFEAVLKILRAFTRKDKYSGLAWIIGMQTYEILSFTNPLQLLHSQSLQEKKKSKQANRTSSDRYASR